MGNPYYRHPAATDDRGSISRPSFPGYLSSEAPSLASHHADMQINPLQPRIYGVDNTSNSRLYPEPNLGGLPAGAIVRAYPPLRDPSLVAQRWDSPVGVSSSVGLHPEASSGGVSAGTGIGGYPSGLEVPNLVGQRRDDPGISPSAGVHPELSLGAVSAGATIRGYSSPLEIPNLGGQRRDAPVGISPSAGFHPEGAVSAGASIPLLL